MDQRLKAAGVSDLVAKDAVNWAVQKVCGAALFAVFRISFALFAVFEHGNAVVPPPAVGMCAPDMRACAASPDQAGVG